MLNCYRLRFVVFFFFKDTPPTKISPLSLHDALPICCRAISAASSRTTPPAESWDCAAGRKAPVDRIRDWRRIRAPVGERKRLRRTVSAAMISSGSPLVATPLRLSGDGGSIHRSEERRVGKECRSRG